MGSVVVSLDAELGWGFHDRTDPPEDRIDRGRWGWDRLVDLFDEFDVPATWAIVGHLLLDDCDGIHRDHPVGESWFAREREGWRDRREWLLAPDLVDKVVTADMDHEIASHAFSHIEFGAPETTKAIARAEIDQSIGAARSLDIDLRSFVFPRRNVGHRDLLADAGFESYRGNGKGRPSPLEKLRRAAGGSAPTLVRPTVDEYGLVDVPESLYLFGFEGLARSLVETAAGDPVVREARRGIDAAATSDKVFHMWLHPNNVTNERDLARMRAVLSYLDQQRDNVRIETMYDVARRVRAENWWAAEAV